jgi:Ser/Thr protein kinase RdoA (MazF antagonist)
LFSASARIRNRVRGRSRATPRPSRGPVPVRRLTTTGPVTIDFDDLTLAPFGYDLAKLTVTLAMTNGPLPAWQITAALDAYNTAAAAGCPQAAAVTWEQLMTWAEIHHILTSRYKDRSGYQHSWHDLRPCQPRRQGDLEG